MIYHPLGPSGVKISAIGFGSMRWPSEELCAAILKHGIEFGMNYVDTSTGYVGGLSEKWTGRAVRSRRDAIYVSSKAHFGRAPRADDIRAAIEGSLRATGLTYFDFYQLWGLGSTATLKAALARGGFLEGVRKAQNDGLVRHGVGFTFHGPPETFRAAVDCGEFLSATVSYNLLNRQEEGNIAYAAERGVAIIVMNPLAGGVLGLAGDASLDFLRASGAGPAHGALRFLLANPGIATSIVGYRARDEVDQAVAALQGAEALTEQDRQAFIRRMETATLPEGRFCTGCGYCKDCPSKVDVPKFMEAMRDFQRYGVPAERLAEWVHSKYAHMDPVRHLDACTACGRCEATCPQHLSIVDSIRRVRAVL